jgi:SAM-dependent methyltransferase
VNDYLYRDSSATGLRRLRGLEAVEDPDTIQCLEALEVAAGMSCLEVGAGGGSIAGWLAERVKPSGSVVATDTDISFLDPTAYEVWRHDIRTDTLPPESFDLVHVRHLLVHIATVEHAVVLRKLCDALRPSGKILIEESDLLSWKIDDSMPDHLALKFAAGVNRILACYRSQGMGIDVGSNLDLKLAACGFVIHRLWRRCRQVSGGSSEAQYQGATALQLRASVERERLEEVPILNEFADVLLDPRLTYRSRTTISVLAQKP